MIIDIINFRPDVMERCYYKRTVASLLFNHLDDMQHHILQWYTGIAVTKDAQLNDMEECKAMLDRKVPPPSVLKLRSYQMRIPNYRLFVLSSDNILIDLLGIHELAHMFPGFITVISYHACDKIVILVDINFVIDHEINLNALKAQVNIDIYNSIRGAMDIFEDSSRGTLTTLQDWNLFDKNQTCQELLELANNPTGANVIMLHHDFTDSYYSTMEQVQRFTNEFRKVQVSESTDLRNINTTDLEIRNQYILNLMVAIPLEEGLVEFSNYLSSNNIKSEILGCYGSVYIIGLLGTAYSFRRMTTAKERTHYEKLFSNTVSDLLEEHYHL